MMLSVSFSFIDLQKTLLINIYYVLCLIELLDESSSPESRSKEEGSSSSSESRPPTPSFQRQVPKSSQVISKLVDNKRKHNWRKTSHKRKETKFS